MGGDKATKETNRMVKNDVGRVQNEHNQDRGRNEADLNSSRGRADQLYGQLHEGYSNFANGTGYGGSGGGGIGVPSDSRFQETEDSYRDFMKTGGVTDENRNRIRGGGVFDEYAKTGGVSDADKSNLRSRGNSVIPAFYDSMKQEGNRMASVQGGYGPGRMAMQGRLARQQAAGAQEAATNTELGIADRVSEGRKWGAGQMSDAEGNLVNITNQGRQWGTSGLQGMAESDRSASMSAAAMNANNDFRNRAYGLGGLNDLYSGQGSGEYNFNKNYALQERGLTDDSINQRFGQRRAEEPWWKSALGAAAGVAGAWAGRPQAGQ